MVEKFKLYTMSIYYDNNGSDEFDYNHKMDGQFIIENNGWIEGVVGNNFAFGAMLEDRGIQLYIFSTSDNKLVSLSCQRIQTGFLGSVSADCDEISKNRYFISSKTLDNNEDIKKVKITIEKLKCGLVKINTPISELYATVVGKKSDFINKTASKFVQYIEPVQIIEDVPKKDKYVASDEIQESQGNKKHIFRKK
jgi:hypothetical protein